MSRQIQRDLLRGSAELIILSALVDEPQYGYLIQKRVRQLSGNLIQLNAGTLYPLLHRLEAEGSVKSRLDKTDARQRKWYELTKHGRTRLRNQAGLWRRFTECVGGILDPAIASLDAT